MDLLSDDSQDLPDFDGLPDSPVPANTYLSMPSLEIPFITQCAPPPVLNMEWEPQPSTSSTPDLPLGVYPNLNTPMPTPLYEEPLPELTDMDFGDIIAERMDIPIIQEHLEPAVNHDFEDAIDLIRDLNTMTISTQTEQESINTSTQTLVKTRDNSTQTNQLDCVKQICIIKGNPRPKPRDATPTRDERVPEEFDVIYID